MKSILTLLLIGVLTQVSAQDDKYTKTMKSTLAKLDTAKTIQSFVKSANKFERIANAEGSKWLPHYWSAYCNILSSMMVKEDPAKQGQYLTNADMHITKADSLSEDNSEIYVLRSFWYTGKMMAEGFQSGMKYGPLSNTALEKAKKLNPENPRYYSLHGTGLAYTPPMFGGGKDKALPILEEGMKKFEAFKPETELHPNWGEDQCKEMIQFCKADDKEKKQEEK